MGLQQTVDTVVKRSADPLRFTCWSPKPNVAAFGDRAFRRSLRLNEFIGVEQWPNWISVLTRQDTENSLVHSLRLHKPRKSHVRTQQERGHLQPREREAGREPPRGRASSGSLASLSSRSPYGLVPGWFSAPSTWDRGSSLLLSPAPSDLTLLWGEGCFPFPAASSVTQGWRVRAGPGSFPAAATGHLPEAYLWPPPAPSLAPQCQ